jgi:hypothetical protein
METPFDHPQLKHRLWEPVAVRQERRRQRDAYVYGAAVQEGQELLAARPDHVKQGAAPEVKIVASKEYEDLDRQSWMVSTDDGRIFSVSAKPTPTGFLSKHQFGVLTEWSAAQVADEKDVFRDVNYDSVDEFNEQFARYLTALEWARANTAVVAAPGAYKSDKVIVTSAGDTLLFSSNGAATPLVANEVGFEPSLSGVYPNAPGAVLWAQDPHSVVAYVHDPRLLANRKVLTPLRGAPHDEAERAAAAARRQTAIAEVAAAAKPALSGMSETPASAPAPAADTPEL